MGKFDEKNAELGAVVARYKEKRSEADFEILYNAAFKPIRAYIVSMCGKNNQQYREENIEDAIQTGFMTFYKDPNKVTQNNAFIGWMQRVCGNEYLAIVRKNHENATDEYEEGDETPKVERGIMPGAFDDTLNFPEEETAQKELTKLILENLDALPEMQRIAIFSFYYDGKSIKDIADDISVPENTVKSYLSRGKKAMNKRIGDYAQAYGLRLVPIALVPFMASLFKTEVQACELTITDEMVHTAFTSFSVMAAKGAVGAAASSSVSAAAVEKTVATSAAAKAASLKVAAAVTAVAVTGGGVAVALYNQNAHVEVPDTIATSTASTEDTEATVAEVEEPKIDYSPFKTITDSLDEENYRFLDLDGDGTDELFVKLCEDNSLVFFGYSVVAEDIMGLEFEVYALDDNSVVDLGTYNGFLRNKDEMAANVDGSVERLMQHREEEIAELSETTTHLKQRDGSYVLNSVDLYGGDKDAIASSLNAAIEIIDYPLLLKTTGVSNVTGYTYSGGTISPSMTFTGASYEGYVDGTATNTVTGESISTETCQLLMLGWVFPAAMPTGYPEQ